MIFTSLNRAHLASLKSSLTAGLRMRSERYMTFAFARREGERLFLYDAPLEGFMWD